MKKLLSLVIVVLFGALLARTCLYTVNEREYALVFMLGELKSVVSTPGLHVKLPAPLQNVVYLPFAVGGADVHNVLVGIRAYGITGKKSFLHKIHLIIM